MKIDDKLIRRAKLRELRVLIAAAHYKSLVRTAEHLGLTQPAVSKALRDLEDLFSVRLFDRTTTGVDLTAQGKIVLRHAQNILDELTLAKEELKEFATAGTGTFGVGCGHAISAGLLPQILNQLLLEHPRIKCRVIEADPGQIFAALRAREIDLVLGRAPVEKIDDLDFEKLYEERLFFVAGEHHALAKRDRVSSAELAGQHWVIPTLDPVVGELARRLFEEHAIPAPEANIASMSIQIAGALLASGRFLTILPGSVLAFHPMRAKMRILPLPSSAPAGAVGIISIKRRDLAPAARLFVERTRRVTASFGELNFGKNVGK